MLYIRSSELFHFIAESLYPFTEISFLFMTQYSTVWMYHILFMQVSIDGHLCCFHLTAIVNSATVNICAHFCLKTCFLPVSLHLFQSWIVSLNNCISFKKKENLFSIMGIYLEVEMLGPMLIIFNLMRNHQTFSQWLHNFTFSPAIYESSGFSSSSATLVNVYIFFIIAILVCAKSYLIMVLICFSLMTNEHPFVCFSDISVSTLQTYLFMSFVHF